MGVQGRPSFWFSLPQSALGSTDQDPLGQIAAVWSGEHTAPPQGGRQSHAH
jgi:hypothetical protein